MIGAVDGMVDDDDGKVAVLVFLRVANNAELDAKPSALAMDG